MGIAYMQTIAWMFYRVQVVYIALSRAWGCTAIPVALPGHHLLCPGQPTP